MGNQVNMVKPVFNSEAPFLLLPETRMFRYSKQSCPVIFRTRPTPRRHFRTGLSHYDDGDQIFWVNMVKAFLKPHIENIVTVWDFLFPEAIKKTKIRQKTDQSSPAKNAKWYSSPSNLWKYIRTGRNTLQVQYTLENTIVR
jgi:hypothetical protein